jgi:hypothetical protein
MLTVGGGWSSLTAVPQTTFRGSPKSSRQWPLGIHELKQSNKIAYACFYDFNVTDLVSWLDLTLDHGREFVRKMNGISVSINAQKNLPPERGLYAPSLQSRLISRNRFQKIVCP